MMNWIQMTASSEAEFEYLHSEIRAKGCLVFDDVLMPPDCGSEVCAIRFQQHETGAVTLGCQPRPRYTGTDRTIGRWCESGALTFRDFGALTRFLRSFSQGAAPEAPAAPAASAPEEPAAPPRPQVRVDRSRLTPRTREEAAFIALDSARLEAALNEHILGQQEAVAKIAHLCAIHLGQRRRKRPLSLLLWGPTGVGKTECGTHLPQVLNRLTEDAYGFHLEVIDCTQLKEEHATSRLTGSPPGYVGHDEPCIWDCVDEHPRTVFVFNELEKAHPNVLQVLMEAVDSGRQQASRIGPGGKRFYDLSQCLFLFTSNLDLNRPCARTAMGFRVATPPPEEPVLPARGGVMGRIIRDNEQARSVLLDQGAYPPEVVGRFTAFIGFQPLSGEGVLELVIQKLSLTAYEQHLLCLTDISADIVQEIYDLCEPQVQTAGVRVIQRVIDIFLGEAFMRFSHQSAEYAQVSLSGCLDAPLVADWPAPVPDPL